MLHLTLLFKCKECNATIDDPIGIMWCLYQWCYLTKKWWCASFQLSWPKACNGTIDKATNITCCQYQWCHMTKMSCCTSFLLSWCKEYNGAIDSVLDIMWYQKEWCHMIKSHVTPLFNCHDLGNSMVQLIMLLASHKASASGFKAKKSNIGPHFDHVDLRDAELPLMILSASHDADTKANGIEWYWWQWYHITR